MNFTCWIPGVNHLGTHGRSAFAELPEVCTIEGDFAPKVAREFNAMLARFAREQGT